MKYRGKIKLKKTYSPHYQEKKPFFSEKEIIFRSEGKAKVLKITSKMQVFFIVLFVAIIGWSAYSYHIYDKSGRILLNKDQELVEARDAYVNLMGDFMAIQKNIDEVLSANKSKDAARYTRQAQVVEEKIKQMIAGQSWADDKAIEDKINLNEVILQRDLAAAERDALREQLQDMEKAVKNIKKAELEVFNKVESIATQEVGKIKNSIAKINGALKQQGLYFNPLANSKKRESKGGAFIPEAALELQDQEMIDKITHIYEATDDLEYYRQVVQYIPFGKPVWSYWVTSKFGYRIDPFNKKAAGHKGVDLAARTGNKIKVMGKGKVVKVEHSNKGYGNLVVVDHGNGFTTKYAHLNKIYVEINDYLDINDTIGEVGSTGRSTGPHLHYEVLFQGKPVDPMPFIQEKLS
ncbi:MAG: M23 family metallopeptidase [Alphaproteobacteria bacterium]|nr:M23 family metallopeptidase [Alphaproteobacteria bacterium]